MHVHFFKLKEILKSQIFFPTIPIFFSSVIVTQTLFEQFLGRIHYIIKQPSMSVDLYSCKFYHLTLPSRTDHHNRFSFLPHNCSCPASTGSTIPVPTTQVLTSPLFQSTFQSGASSPCHMTLSTFVLWSSVLNIPKC